MGKLSKICAVIALLTLLLAGCSIMPRKPGKIVPGDYSYTKEYISWLIHKEMKKHDVTGLSIALVDDKQVLWAEGFGFADKAAKLPATPKTVYRAGSISKLFTDTVAMQLAEQGKLDIDKPLQTYLPEFSIKSRFSNSAPITPRNIMTHHSGIPSDLLKGMWTKNPEPFQNEVKLLREEYAAYPPNFVYAYSNVGVTILGHALEKVAGLEFRALMAGSLLRPLGMTHSSFSQDPDHSPAASKAYRNGKETEETPLRGVPAGGLNSSVLDLSRFMQMIFAGGKFKEEQIIKPETLAMMLQAQNADVPLDLSFRTGLGWALSGMGDINFRNAGPVAHHSGATLYHRGMLIVLPEHKLGVVVLANSASAGSTINKVAVEALKSALDAKTGIIQPKQIVPPEGKGTMSREELQGYAGQYATMAGVVRISSKSDYLRAEMMGKTLRLVPRPDGLLALRYRLLGLVPVSLGELDHLGIGRARVAGRDILRARLDGQELLVGERLAEKPIPGKWLQRQGEYEITNAGDDTLLVEKISLRQEGGFLVIEYSLPLFTDGRMSLALAPLSETEAVISGLGRGMGETIRAVDVGGEELLLYSGYLLRKKPE